MKAADIWRSTRVRPWSAWQTRSRANSGRESSFRTNRDSTRRGNSDFDLRQSSGGRSVVEWLLPLTICQGGFGGRQWLRVRQLYIFPTGYVGSLRAQINQAGWTKINFVRSHAPGSRNWAQNKLIGWMVTISKSWLTLYQGGEKTYIFKLSDQETSIMPEKVKFQGWHVQAGGIRRPVGTCLDNCQDSNGLPKTLARLCRFLRFKASSAKSSSEMVLTPNKR